MTTTPTINDDIDTKAPPLMMETERMDPAMDNTVSKVDVNTVGAEAEALLKGKESDKLTKRQLKKLAKKQKYEEIKRLRRAKTRAKQKELKDKIRQGLLPPIDTLSRKEKKRHTMKNSMCKVGIAIDMSFNDLMIEKDMGKTIKQIHRCYSINRKETDPIQYYVTSFGGTAKEMISKHDGWENWDVQFTTKRYMELEEFPKHKLVYLSSESENVLTKIEPDFLYVIGGLVDHNGHKGLCHSLAIKNGVNHARLPIQEHLDMKTRKILTIDHVFEILLKVAKGISWQTALLNVIAPRKMAQAKLINNEDNDS